MRAARKGKKDEGEAEGEEAEPADRLLRPRRGGEKAGQQRPCHRGEERGVAGGEERKGQGAAEEKKRRAIDPFPAPVEKEQDQREERAAEQKLVARVGERIGPPGDGRPLVESAPRGEKSPAGRIQSCEPNGLIRVARLQSRKRAAPSFPYEPLPELHQRHAEQPRQAEGEAAVQVGPEDHRARVSPKRKNPAVTLGLKPTEPERQKKMGEGPAAEGRLERGEQGEEDERVKGGQERRGPVAPRPGLDEEEERGRQRDDLEQNDGRSSA